VLELLFSAGLVAVLRRVEPQEKPSLALVHRLIVASARNDHRLCEVPLLDAMVHPPRNGGSVTMAVTLPELRLLCPPDILICSSSSPNLSQTITSQRPAPTPLHPLLYTHSSTPTPLHPLLFTTTLSSRVPPPIVERSRRRPHGPETARTRRPTTTKYLGAGPSTPPKSCRTLSTQTEEQTPARILLEPYRPARYVEGSH
jgi:hypothetical protein